MQRREDLGQRGDRVGHRAAEAPGVEVEGSALDVHLDSSKTAEPGAERRQARRDDRRVGDHENVGPEAFLLARHDVLEVDGAGLLLALDDQLEVEWQLAADGEDCLHRFEVHPYLPLVVNGAPRIQIPVADLRLEGRRAPLIERVDRLDIVVAVDECRRQRRIHEALGVDRGMPGGFDELGVVKADLASLGGEVLGVAPDVGGMCRIGRDAWDPEGGNQLVDVALLIAGAVVIQVRIWHFDSLKLRPLRLHPL